MVAAFPRSLIYSPEDLEDLNLDYRRIHTRMMVRMEILQNEFLLARLLSRKGHKVDGDILVTSFELVTLCVNLWTHFDRFGKMQRDFEWIVSRPSLTESNPSKLTCVSVNQLWRTSRGNPL